MLHFFINKDNKGLTGREFNTLLAELTNDITVNSNCIIRSHSLRAGVPSDLAKRGADPIQIQGVGRCQSDAWKDCFKLERIKRINMKDQLCKTIE